MEKLDEEPSAGIDEAKINTGQQETEVDVQKLAGRVEEIKREISLLEKQQAEARIIGNEERKKLSTLWKQGVIKSDEEFSELSGKIGEQEEFFYQQIRRKHTEYRLVRINFLSHAKPPDILRQRVIDLNLREVIHKLQGENIQAGGSNALGVFEIENGEFVLIKKSKETYEFEGALPYLMQDITTSRIPRVLEVFETDDATYKVMEKARGVQVDKLSEDQVAEIPQEYFDQFVEDISSLDALGLQIDPSKKSNFFYDNEIGFSIIDIGDLHYDPTRKNIRSNIHLGDLKAVFTGPKQDQRIIIKIEEAIRKQAGNMR